MSLTDKAGSAIADAPASLPDRHRVASAGQVSKFEALFNVLGHSIARFPDGRTVQVTPGGLKIISFHGGLNA